MTLLCPKCKADQALRWESVAIDQIEGRDWYCPNCRVYLMMLLGRITVVYVPPPGGGASPLPPAPPGR
jgi:hypothetical protein